MKIKINIPINHIDSEIYGEIIHDEFELIIKSNSSDLFYCGKNIEKYTGLSLNESDRYQETETDAYIYGLVNVMNDGNDLFLFVNSARLYGDIKLKGKIKAIAGFLTHEAGIHLSNRLIQRYMSKKYGLKEMNKEWLEQYYVPDEETQAVVGEYLVETLIDTFIEIF